MGKINLGKASMLKDSVFLEKRFDREITELEAQESLNKIASLENLIGENEVAYVFGMGAQPKSVYSKLRLSEDYQLTWYGSILPMLLKPLSGLIASHAGLIKIINPKGLVPLFETLIESSMAGLFVFDKKDENAFIKAVKNGNKENEADAIAEKSPGFLCYYIDADNYESETGIYEIVAYGKDCKESIKKIWR